MVDTTTHFRRILVVCTRQIGDVLLTTPLIHAARRRWPDARIDVLGFAGTLGMLEGNPDISELIEMPARARLPDHLRLLRRLWRGYDLAVLTQRSDREYIIGCVAAKVRVGLHPGFERKDAWKRRLLRHAVPDSLETVHIVAEKLRLLDPWLASVASVSVIAPPEAPLPPDVAAVMQHAPIVVHIPSMWRYKQWPLGNFRVLIEELIARGHRVVLTGGPSESDRRLVGDVVAGLADRNAFVDACGRLDFNQLATLLRGARLYIGPDTSVTHLAAACGIPVIALFGPTNPMVWGPWPQGASPEMPYVLRADLQRAGRVVVLQGGLACVPCRMEGCERHRDSRSDCLETMSAERVVAAAMQLLAVD